MQPCLTLTLKGMLYPMPSSEGLASPSLPRWGER